MTPKRKKGEGPSSNGSFLKYGGPYLEDTLGLRFRVQGSIVLNMGTPIKVPLIFGCVVKP